MKAEEMFKELGYSYDIEKRHICAYPKYNDNGIEVEIDFIEKKVYLGTASSEQTHKLFLAIQQQILELGW